MTSQFVLTMGRDALTLLLTISLPVLGVVMAVGLVVSIFQAVTQIQEQTLSFGIKLIAVSATILLTARWVGGEMFNFTVQIFDSIPSLGR